jgi:ribosome recycling factor
VVRLPIPPLTEERRKDLVKQVRKMAEEARIRDRNHRREANEMLKDLEKDGDISEDDCKKGLDRVQKETDEAIKAIDAVVTAKEKEIMEV